ncbi:hypothetical protein BJV85_002816 [Clostridium acetobutylicum]|uniref:Phage related protein, YorF B.subtilis homolog n=1 Tax=Clostridium acetobutylicum (strain ATCC 824 / DSM 792 / JCM 1419 / IAM 19013 / LMG 5710 / NBRC 13948 / NRRL B-527 / VKM B-1787 / 2291 / W) TaxID=272562 RepID=Q97JU2_CLOAB|nr:MULTISPECIES: hypothetical protein [Clostridium]AAK79153.1 Phage related protein, YorF B.subtilis homolog [Clostridium acetobutylicum ATCC 824]ADZ20231.1 Phage related protein [Clostridium acetobutylicum EA 2018]AEI31688.1 hypothetical protein SMB_G1201 [Clostridium acetobutylicum DSM 1731]AWV81594.1 hypothetical protein DK921_16145 [Clostridium acetobutylicum]MBC2393235.1 hypothetical protein [Clostridium acetobutylicum]
MAKQEYKGILQEQKGSFRLRGRIQGLTEPRKSLGFEDVPEKADKRAYRKIRFILQTSDSNSPVVEVFGCTQDNAYAYNKEKEKALAVDWNKRNNPLPKGYEIIETDYDLAKRINDDFKDGMDVVIIGKPSYSTYQNKDGVTKEQYTLNISKVQQCTNPINFSDEKFKEENNFTQEITIREVREDKKEQRLYIYAYIIGYAGRFEPATFRVNIETNPMFAKVVKGFKFGDVVKVNGIIENRVVVQNTDWGTQVGSNFDKCLLVTGADPKSYIKKKYKNTDFVKTQKQQAEDIFNGNASQDNLSQEDDNGWGTSEENMENSNNNEVFPFQL